MEVTPPHKVLYVITKANWGGAQRYVFDLASAAKAKGYGVAVAYGTPGELADRLKAEEIETFEIAGLGRDVDILKDARVFFSLCSIIHTAQPDVVHLNSSKIGGLGALAARVCGTKHIVFTAHAWAFNEDRPAYQKLVIKFLAWLTVMLAKKTIVVSEAMKRQAARWPFIKSKLSVIPNGTRDHALLERAEARRELIQLHPALAVSDAEHDTWIGTVAELHPVKGLPYAIEAIAALVSRHTALRYLILSGGQMREELEQLIAKRNLQERVFLLGHVTDAPKYGRAYDIFVLPSLSEAFGIAALEAGIAALPVVATRVGGLPEIIEDGVTGLLVPPRDSGALEKALEALLTDTKLRGTLGTQLRAKVLKEFSIERLVEKTFALYEA